MLKAKLQNVAHGMRIVVIAVLALAIILALLLMYKLHQRLDDRSADEQ